MDYARWIERERRIRLKILRASPRIRETGLFRVCGDCGEICLCHEEACPECGCGDVSDTALPGITDRDITERIRCTIRFNAIDKTDS